jgi:hypothetical protein
MLSARIGTSHGRKHVARHNGPQFIYRGVMSWRLHRIQVIQRNQEVFGRALKRLVGQIAKVMLTTRRR